MAVFSRGVRPIAKAIADIAFGNPFSPGRIVLERQALGPDFVEAGPVIRVRSEASFEAMFPNVGALHRRAEALAEAARKRLCSAGDVAEADLCLYEDLVCYVLYNRHVSVVHEPVRRSLASPGWGGPVERWPAFHADFRAYLEVTGRAFPSRYRPEHAFAVAFQVARAFHATFESIVGGSLPTARLRAAVW